MMLQGLSYGVEDKQIARLGYLPDRKGEKTNCLVQGTPGTF